MIKSAFLLGLLFLALSTNIFPKINTKTLHYSDAPATIKGNVTAQVNGANADSVGVPNAVLTLTAVNNASLVYTSKTDDTGAFIFENIPSGKYILMVESVGLPKATREIIVESGAVLSIDVDLTVEVSEQVTVRYEEGLLSTSETTTSNVIRAETIKSQPFRDEEYQNALPLTPGVVKDSANNSYIKGSRAGQSRFTVNGADVTDPVTGSSVFEIPLEAVGNIKVEENPFSAEFGQFTGGYTQLQTKGGGNKFDFKVSRLFPTFGGFFSGKIESFRPRFTVSGPIIKDRLFFLQSFEYRFRREINPDLPEGADFRKIERLTSFTQIDYTINKTNQLKFNFAMFPQKTRFANVDFFNPQISTYNVKQRGYLISASEQSVFKNTSFLSSSFNFYNADYDIFGQGGANYTIVSDFNRGSYFADTRRRSNRFQLSETYYFAPFEFAGKHSLKTGVEFDRSDVSYIYNYSPIFFRRSDLSLAQTISFTKPDQTKFKYNEIGTFVQNNWVVNPHLTLDIGLRYDYDGIAKDHNFSPRLSFLYSPFRNNRTLIRAGVGVFYDRTLPVAGYFANAAPFYSQNNIVPERTVTIYNSAGTSIASSRQFTNVIAGNISTPRSFRWSIFVDRGITKNLTFRFGYLRRTTRKDLVVEPFITSDTTGINLLSSTGDAKYREFQFLLNYISPKFGNFNFSYTNTKAVGDLNTADVITGNFPALNIQPNQYGLLPFDATHRFLTYGQIALPHDILLAPMIEYRTGFPFSAVNDRLEFVGERNRAGRFPDYFSIDVQVTKGFRIHAPIIRKYKLRGGVALFNITSHFNPRDVQNNIFNPNYGTFYNSLGFGTKLQFGVDM